ncbi:MAG: hypothetical protein H6624_00145 [Bdellovibrionaceae bacterium]|nr:hypothetical protein [Bdellovibrionales bacterium]MCB9082716.1 hypothetical protein [Pseudobdellovibrionaceae bacterium]
MNKVSLFVSLILGVLVYGGADSSALAQEKFVLVVNAKNSVTQVDSGIAKDIYFGRKLFWESGVKIRPALLDQKNPVTSSFLSGCLDTETSRYLAFWRRRLFSGRGVPPKQFQSEKELLEFVSQNEGAIAVVSTPPSGQAASQLKVIPLSN